MLKVGDEINLKDENGNSTNANIVKVCESSKPFYIVIQNERFVYTTTEDMRGSRRERKRMRTDDESVSTEITVNSTASASHWLAAGELKNFNVKFKRNAIASEYASDEEIKTFFESPDNIDVSSVQAVIDHWSKVPPAEWIDQHKALVIGAYDYLIEKSETSVESYVSSMLQALNLERQLKVYVRFGIVDMLVSAKFKLEHYSAVIKIKVPETCEFSKWEPYRAHLVAYIIGIALKNEKNLNQYQKTYEYQNIVAILHLGLTPIFYKTRVTKQYLEDVAEKLESHNKHEMTGLVIEEFVPVTAPFSDVEVYFGESRAPLMKSYFGFKMLQSKYMKEKTEKESHLSL